jgi:hypothetical protein
MTRRAMLRFRHADAVENPKPNRPATVAAAPIGGHYLLFYGSTFKHGGSPAGAILADPRAPTTEPAGELARYLGEAIDEPTCFHGSLISETHSSDSSIKPYPTRFPADEFDRLEEQAEGLRLAFAAAWKNLDWLAPKQRAFALDALWWKLEVDAATELALTLLLYDGLTPRQIAALSWGSTGTRLPRTRSLLEKRRPPGKRDGDPVVDESLALLENGWQQLCGLGLRAKPKVHLPGWSRVLDLDQPDQ